MLVRKFVTTVSLTLIAGLFPDAHASATRTCSDIFKSEKREPARPTVQVTGIIMNAAREKFFRLTLLPGAKNWHSGYRIGKYNPQGNPRWIQLYLGEALADVLGYKFGRGEMLAPTPTTLNKRIERFNLFLVRRGIDPIPYRFYEQKDGELETFLKNWDRRMAAPKAMTMDTDTVHDIAYHDAIVLLPSAIGRLLQIDAGLAREWLKESKDQPVPESVVDIATVIDVLSSINNVPEGQSFGDSHLTEMLTPYLADLTNRNADAFAVRWHEYAVSHTPFDLFHRKLMAYKVVIPNFGSPAQELQFIKRFPRTSDMKREKDFRLKMAYKHPDWTEQTLAEMGLGSLPEIQAMLQQRADELRGAARDFLMESDTAGTLPRR